MYKNLKKYIKCLLLVVTVVMVWLNFNQYHYVKASTSKPTEVTTSNATEKVENAATPTPEPQNIIKSIGDFELYGKYIDDRKVDKNIAINTVIYKEEFITEEIISAVRAQNSNQDIISIIGLELLQNGRPISQEAAIKVFIKESEFFEEFENITLYKIVESTNISNVIITREDSHIIFEEKGLGQYVVCGEKIAADATLVPSETKTPLQEDTDAGIIMTNPSPKAPNSEDGGILSPGAFVFWLIVALIIGLWVGLGFGYILWGRYKNKKGNKGPYVIGE